MIDIDKKIALLNAIKDVNQAVGQINPLLEQDEFTASLVIYTTALGKLIQEVNS